MSRMNSPIKNIDDLAKQSDIMYGTLEAGSTHDFFKVILSKQEQDKSSDIEQQPPFGDRKYSNTLPQKRGDLSKIF